MCVCVCVCVCVCALTRTTLERDRVTFKCRRLSHCNWYDSNKVASGPSRVDITATTQGQPYENISHDWLNLFIHPSWLQLIVAVPIPIPTLTAENKTEQLWWYIVCDDHVAYSISKYSIFKYINPIRLIEIEIKLKLKRNRKKCISKYSIFTYINPIRLIEIELKLKRNKKKWIK